MQNVYTFTLDYFFILSGEKKGEKKIYSIYISPLGNDNNIMFCINIFLLETVLYYNIFLYYL